MNFNTYRLPLILGLAAFLLPMAGCTKKPSKPPQVYTTAENGAKDSNELIERFKTAYAARDADAAMRLFYWHAGESPKRQESWWDLLNEMFATPAKTTETAAPNASKAQTDFPVVGRFTVTTSNKQYDALLIGKNEHGFYFMPPLWPDSK